MVELAIKKKLFKLAVYKRPESLPTIGVSTTAYTDAYAAAYAIC